MSVRIPWEVREDILNRWAQGESADVIAAETGRGRKSVWNIVDRARKFGDARAASRLPVTEQERRSGGADPNKRAVLAALGAEVNVHGAAYPEALVACLQRQARTGALLMHAYDQAEVVAGAGTIGLEIEEDAGVPDRVLVSVGGGGLIAGIAAWFEGHASVEALEPVLAPTLHAARVAGDCGLVGGVGDEDQAGWHRGRRHGQRHRRGSPEPGQPHRYPGGQHHQRSGRGHARYGGRHDRGWRQCVGAL